MKHVDEDRKMLIQAVIVRFVPPPLPLPRYVLMDVTIQGNEGSTEDEAPAFDPRSHHAALEPIHSQGTSLLLLLSLDHADDGV